MAQRTDFTTVLFAGRTSHCFTAHVNLQLLVCS